MPISSKNIEENRKTVEELIDKNAKYYTLSSDVYNLRGRISMLTLKC